MMINTMSLFNAGIESGKVEMPENHLMAEDRIAFQQIYDVAVLAANESQEDAKLTEESLDDDDDENKNMVILLVLATLCCILTVGLFAYCCYRYS